MTRNEVLYKVIEIINEHKSAGSPKATENSRFAEDLGMDSLDRFESAAYIERRLNFEFDYKEDQEVIYNIKTVKDVVNLVCKKLNIPVIDVKKIMPVNSIVNVAVNNNAQNKR